MERGTEAMFFFIHFYSIKEKVLEKIYIVTYTKKNEKNSHHLVKVKCRNYLLNTASSSLVFFSAVLVNKLNKFYK